MYTLYLSVRSTKDRISSCGLDRRKNEYVPKILTGVLSYCCAGNLYHFEIEGRAEMKFAVAALAILLAVSCTAGTAASPRPDYNLNRNAPFRPFIASKSCYLIFTFADYTRVPPTPGIPFGPPCWLLGRNDPGAIAACRATDACPVCAEARVLLAETPAAAPMAAMVAPTTAPMAAAAPAAEESAAAPAAIATPMAVPQAGPLFMHARSSPTCGLHHASCSGYIQADVATAICKQAKSMWLWSQSPSIAHGPHWFPAEILMRFSAAGDPRAFRMCAVIRAGQQQLLQVWRDPQCRPLNLQLLQCVPPLPPL